MTRLLVLAVTALAIAGCNREPTPTANLEAAAANITSVDANAMPEDDTTDVPEDDGDAPLDNQTTPPAKTRHK